MIQQIEEAISDNKWPIILDFSSSKERHAWRMSFYRWKKKHGKQLDFILTAVGSTALEVKPRPAVKLITGDTIKMVNSDLPDPDAPSITFFDLGLLETGDE